MKTIGKIITSVTLMLVLLLTPANLAIALAQKPKTKTKTKQKKVKRQLTVKELTQLMNNHRVLKERNWNAMVATLKKLTKLKLSINRKHDKKYYEKTARLIRQLNKAIKVYRNRHAYHAQREKEHKATLQRIETSSVKQTLIGEASWYSDPTCNYGTTITAAMRGFRGSKVKVTNLANNQSVTVLINDYGPAAWTGRVIDLSQASFARIANLGQGVIPRVKVEIY